MYGHFSVLFSAPMVLDLSWSYSCELRNVGIGELAMVSAQPGSMDRGEFLRPGVEHRLLGVSSLLLTLHELIIFMLGETP